MALCPFLLSPTWRLWMVAGTSATRKPRDSTAMSSSADWYCGCSSRTAPVTSARIARSPNEVSVIRSPVRTLIVTANSQVPRRRTGSLVSWLPSFREPVTKSACPATTGARTRSISAGLYWPSASVVTMYCAPPSRASRYPRRRAAPWPRFTVTSATRAPCIRASLTVSSFEPSDTTTAWVASPQMVAGRASTTEPMTPCSL